MLVRRSYRDPVFSHGYKNGCYNKYQFVTKKRRKFESCRPEKKNLSLVELYVKNNLPQCKRIKTGILVSDSPATIVYLSILRDRRLRLPCVNDQQIHKSQ